MVHIYTYRDTELLSCMVLSHIYIYIYIYIHRDTELLSCMVLSHTYIYIQRHRVAVMHGAVSYIYIYIYT